MPHPTRDTLRSKVLVEFAAGPADARILVIVESRRPPVPSAAVKTIKQLGIGRIPRAMAAGATKGMVSLPTQMTALEAELKRMELDTKARRLDLAGSFVVEVSPRQLRELASAPSVQAIRPNRLNRRTVL